MTSHWFEYPIRVHPHHTDYGGIVWHGKYVAWLEETRVEVLRHLQMPFERFVQADVNLVVADMSLRYRRPLTMGADAVVLARPEQPKGVRLPWLYELRSRDRHTLYLESTVQLAAVKVSNGQIYRRLPEQLRVLYDRMEGMLLASDVVLS
ncbi:thioesterase family protein [Synechococcus sp. PCC 7336]|uniref:acyl-CoA thioesterase n=1 Tax=Synechococcus sp. PCC 7336 TaxID=195250 RepID=UPI00034B4DE3|nr:thioesterase family protein [Synechococcus sp. PCC 7336]